MHFTDFLAAQLRQADVLPQAMPDLAWLDAPLDHLAADLPSPYVVLIASCAPGHNYKRWPLRSYADFAQRLQRLGIAVVAVGAGSDRDLVTTMRGLVPQLIDLTGETDLLQLAAVLRHSLAVVGNDTGPTHLAAALGCPTLALLSDRVSPTWSAPKGRITQWLQAGPMSSLSVDKVSLAFESLLAHKTRGFEGEKA